MNLADNEKELHREGGKVRIRRTYPAGHFYDFTFVRSELYCPHCGAQDVWIEDSPGDYYVGPEHRCNKCGGEFCLP